jgi:Cys-tRNA(Pro)/Cys-tRNA(Cys) deacylase
MIRAVAAKTNAARILDKLGISYELREYDVDPEDLSAETVARKIGLPLDQVWKTLVARGDRTGVLLAVIAGSAQLDLKALARLSGNRSVDTVRSEGGQPLTGYIRGGVTALAAKKDYPVYRRREHPALRRGLGVGRDPGHPDPHRSHRLFTRRERDRWRHRHLIVKFRPWASSAGSPR